MKLYLLRPKRYDENQDGLRGSYWEPWYDKTFGFVIRAENEQKARYFAAEHCGNEGTAAWLETDASDCTELTANGEPGIIIEDHARA